MAVFVHGIPGSKTRGSVGGLTFTNWRGLSVMKRKPIPVRRMRTTQPRIRSILGYLARAYGDLSDAQREAWRDYAANHPRVDSLGTTYQMTAEQVFISLNHQRMRLWTALTYQGDPPVEDPPASVNALVAVHGANPGEIDLTWNHNGVPEASDKNEVWISRPYLSAGRVEVHEQYHWYVSTAGNISMTTLVSLIPDAWYWIRIRYVDEYGVVTAWALSHSQAEETP